jgi:hypothetical protein
MGQSYRIRTELGITKTINVQLDQEFEQLEILSLKLQQEDVYTRSCADYGVLVGRITANNGFGLPNARVSIFIPITNIDESNPIISSIYPYKSPTDKNEDGYRYNLLPYEKSYSTHAATGTLPSRLDALTGSTAVEIFDKYYKFTAKTNDSGDYMIMGVPLGYQTVVMDVDLSDIGEFSLTPQDLIRMGLATEAQVAGSRFRTSNDINSLPQIVNLVKNLEISPLWGDPTVCDIAINRLDFDLRDNANIDIQPTSVFMGSIYSTADGFRIRQSAKPKDDMGNLCSLQAGPGQILAIRQTIQQGSDGNPILEQYELEQAGNIIDGDGVWLTELPMNLDYYITNEFGENVISNDPTIGIPTKAKYRFKIKWSQPPTLTEQTRRPYYLVPNVREYGWSNVNADPNYSTLTSVKKRLAGSYYFGLDWSGYTNVDAAVSCEDTFYEFQYNRVYTVSGLIDEFKNGGRGRFIGIKEIDSQDCDSTINKFPVNEGFRNFDLLYFLFSIVFQIIQVIGVPLLIVYHVAAAILNKFANPLLVALSFWISKNIIQLSLMILVYIAMLIFTGGTSAGGIASTTIQLGLWVYLLSKVKDIKEFIDKIKIPSFKIPMITYPDCQACNCGDNYIPPSTTSESSIPGAGLLSQVSNSALYTNALSGQYSANLTTTISEAMATFSNGSIDNPLIFKCAKSSLAGFDYSIQKQTLPIGERINVFNTRNKYFEGVNKIKVTFASDNNLTYHYDNTLTILATSSLDAGTLLTFVEPTTSTDKNYLWTGNTGGNVIRGINGTLQTNQFNINVKYADPNNTNNELTTVYTIPQNTSVQCVNSVTVNVTNLGTITYGDCNGNSNTYNATTTGTQTIINDNCISIATLAGTATFNVTNSGDTCQRYLYPSDIEYYQVLTAITISTTTINGVTVPVLPNSASSGGFYEGVLRQNSIIENYQKQTIGYPSNAATLESTVSLNPTDYFENFTDQVILVLQRGVDPYSPLLTNKYSIGALFGTNENDVNWTFTASTRLNVPIQKIPNGSPTSIQQHNNQDNIYFQSNFYTPGIIGSTTPGLQYSSYTTSNVGYYGALDGISTGRAVIVPGATYTSSSVVNQTPIYGTAKGVSTLTTNVYYDSAVSVNEYDTAEDLSGGAILRGNPLTQYPANTSTLPNTQVSYGPFGTLYFSPILYPSLTGTSQLNITNYSKNIMRTDRLPSSDYIDSGNLRGNVSLLQQNLGFAIYTIETTTIDGIVVQGFSTGASVATADIEGQIASINVLQTLSVCENMVGLNCYTGNSVNFGVKAGCNNADSVQNGCYVFVVNPWDDLQKDINAWAEWGYRFRFFYGLCRGVLAQTFTNNWVNGSLYMFPIQVDTYFDNQNKPLPPKFAKQLVYFDESTNNFYYRSSPYYSGSTTSQRFIGRPTVGLQEPVNDRNLLFPTTIINLGVKSDIYKEIIYDASAKGYIMDSLNPSSYSDTSDLVNLFVISRITDEGWLQQLISPNVGDNGLNQLFSRPDYRIDGDLAQSMSINSEYGVIPFSPEFYPVYGNSDDPVVILGGLDNPTMGVFFSSTTEDLQNKDYLSPGVINFRPTPTTSLTYPYGIKSQYVPFYQWELSQPGIQNIFGSQDNDWKTNESPNLSNSGIFGFNYQSLDRRNINPPTYFVGANNTSDIYQRGYIFNVNSNGEYSFSMAGVQSSKFLVSAPNHFYFGIIKGNTALDKFKTKYSVGE